MSTPPTSGKKAGTKGGTVQWGLRLPDGTVVWPPGDYKGHPLHTPQDRAVLASVLAATARDLGFHEPTFLAHYGWAQRVVHEVPATEPIDSEAALADEPLQPGDGEGR